MADYGLKYRARFGSRFGGQFETHILERDYDGEAIDLLFSGQHPEVGFVHASATPLTVTWGRKGSEIYTPVLASRASAEFWKVGPTPLLNDLRGAGPGKFLMEIWHVPFPGRSEVIEEDGFTYVLGDGRYLYWKGRVKTDTYGDSTMTKPNKVTIEASDGLGALKKAPYMNIQQGVGYNVETGQIFDSTTMTEYEDRATLLSHIMRCFDNLPFTLPLSIAMEWHPVQSRGEAVTGSPVGRLAVSSRAFYDDDGDPMKCHKVLKQIGYVTGAQFYQREGRWHMTQRELLGREEGHVRKRYDADGNYTGAANSKGALVIDLAGGHDRLSGSRKWRSVRGRATLNYNYRELDPLAPNGNFQGTDGRFPVNWEPVTGHTLYNDSGWDPDPENYQQGRPNVEKTGGTFTTESGAKMPNYALRIDSFFHGGLTDSYAVRKRVVEHGQKARFNPSTPLPAGTSLNCGAEFRPIQGPEGDEGWLHETYWSLRVGDYYLKATEPDERGEYEDAEWVAADLLDEAEAEHTNFIRAPLDGDHNDDGVPIESENDFLFVTPPHPTGGEVTLTLYATSDKDNKSGGFLGIGAEPQLNTVGFVWDNIVLEIADTDGEVLSGRKTIASSGAEGEKNEIEVFIGQGPTQTHKTRLTWGESRLSENATDWKRGEYGEAEEASGVFLDALMAGTWIRAQSSPLENRQEKYRGLLRENGRLWHIGEALRIDDAPALGGGGVETAYFHPSYDAKDLYAGTCDVEIVRLILPDLAIDYEAKPVGGDSFDAPKGSGSQGLTVSTGSTGKLAQALSLLAGNLASKNPLGTLAASASGEVTELEVDSAALGALKEGDLAVAVSAENGRGVPFEVAQNPAADSSTVAVGQPDAPETPLTLTTPLPIGSGVYFAHVRLVEALRRVEAEAHALTENVDALQEAIEALQNHNHDGRYRAPGERLTLGASDVTATPEGPTSHRITVQDEAGTVYKIDANEL